MQPLSKSVHVTVDDIGREGTTMVIEAIQFSLVFGPPAE